MTSLRYETFTEHLPISIFSECSVSRPVIESLPAKRSFIPTSPRTVLRLFPYHPQPHPQPDRDPCEPRINPNVQRIDPLTPHSHFPVTMNPVDLLVTWAGRLNRKFQITKSVFLNECVFSQNSSTSIFSLKEKKPTSNRWTIAVLQMSIFSVLKRCINVHATNYAFSFDWLNNQKRSQKATFNSFRAIEEKQLFSYFNLSLYSQFHSAIHLDFS